MTAHSGTSAAPLSPFDRTLSLSGRVFWAVALFSLVLNLLLLTSPLYMLQVYDRVLASGAYETLFYVTLIALGALVALGLLEGLRQVLLSRFGAWLHLKVAGPVLAASMERGLTARPVGAQGLRELQTIQNFLASRMVLPIFDAPWTPVFIAIIWMLHPGLGLFSLVSCILLFGIAVANDIVTRSAMETSSRTASGATHMAEQALANAATLKSMGMLPALLARYGAASERAQSAGADAAERGGWISGASKAVRLALQVGILGLGALFVLDGTLSAGGMIAASILLSRALAPVEQSIGSWRSFRSAREARTRLTELFSDWSEETPAAVLPAPEGRLSLEGVTVAAPSGEGFILKNISFKLEAGESLAIIGPSAAGKSTLVAAIAGARALRQGHVRLDGADLRQYPPSQIGSAIGYLPQSVELFDATVMENIARLGTANPQAVYDAAKLAGVHDMITALPQGYETHIGHGGAHLSGGQKQRIGLARAVFGEPALVLLDEPSANLDQEGELALAAAIAALKASKTTVVMIAHRPNQIADMDKIALIKDGQLAKFGPRDEVLGALSGPRLKVSRAAGKAV